MDDLILFGGGGHCRSVIDVIEQEQKFNIVGIVDQTENIGKEVLGYKIFASDDDLPALKKSYTHAFVTVGHIYSNTVRIELFKKLIQTDFILPFIISPHAYFSKHAIIHAGSIIMHQALVNAGATIGKNCIINSKALVEHDANIQDNSHISTGAIVNGGTVIHENSFLGSHSTTKEYIITDGFHKAGTVIK